MSENMTEYAGSQKKAGYIQIRVAFEMIEGLFENIFLVFLIIY